MAAGRQNLFILSTFGLLVDILGKILYFRPSWWQYFRYAIGRRPPWLPFLGPTLAFVKGRRVQSTAFCQAWTRHIMSHGKAFYCAPNIFVCHFPSPVILVSLPLMMAEEQILIQKNFMKISLSLQQVAFPRIWSEKAFSCPKILYKNYFWQNSWQTRKNVLHFDSSKEPNQWPGASKLPQGPGIQTPSYILSPLDLGPWKHFLECPFLFLLSFLSGHSKHRRGNPAAFFYFVL